MKSWVLVADGSRARIYQSKHFKLKLVASIESNIARLHSHDLGSEKPRGIFEMNVPQNRVDLHAEEEKHFAYHVAKLLNDGAKNGEFQSIMLVAAPRFLGVLRKLLRKNTMDLVEKEVEKDLTRMKDEEVADLIYTKSR